MLEIFNKHIENLRRIQFIFILAVGVTTVFLFSDRSNELAIAVSETEAILELSTELDNRATEAFGRQFATLLFSEAAETYYPVTTKIDLKFVGNESLEGGECSIFLNLRDRFLTTADGYLMDVKLSQPHGTVDTEYGSEVTPSTITDVSASLSLPILSRANSETFYFSSRQHDVNKEVAYAPSIPANLEQFELLWNELGEANAVAHIRGISDEMLFITSQNFGTIRDFFTEENPPHFLPAGPKDPTPSGLRGSAVPEGDLITLPEFEIQFVSFQKKSATSFDSIVDISEIDEFLIQSRAEFLDTEETPLVFLEDKNLRARATFWEKFQAEIRKRYTSKDSSLISTTWGYTECYVEKDDYESIGYVLVPMFPEYTRVLLQKQWKNTLPQSYREYVRTPTDNSKFIESFPTLAKYRDIFGSNDRLPILLKKVQQLHQIGSVETATLAGLSIPVRDFNFMASAIIVAIMMYMFVSVLNVRQYICQHGQFDTRHHIPWVGLEDNALSRLLMIIIWCVGPPVVLVSMNLISFQSVNIHILMRVIQLITAFVGTFLSISIFRAISKLSADVNSEYEG